MKKMIGAIAVFAMQLVAQTEAKAQAPTLPRVVGHAGGPANGVVEEDGLVYWLMGPTLLTGRFDGITERMEAIGRTPVLPEIARDLAVAGGFAYVTDAAGLRVIDARDVARPRLAGSLNLLQEPRDVAATIGGTVYLASALLGLQVVDARDAANPALANEILMVSGATGVAVDGNRLAVVDGSFGVRFYDLSDPLNPAEVGQFVRDGLSGFITFDGPRVYLGVTQAANNAEGFLIVDATDPANAVELSFYNTGALPTGIDVVGGYAHVMGDGFPEFEVVDVSDPANPQVPLFGGSRLTLRGDGGDVAVIGMLAYVSMGDWGLRVVDLRSLDELEEVADYSPAGLPFDIKTRDGLAYVASYAGLRVLDVRNPAAPTPAGGRDYDDFGVGVALNGPDLYLGTIDGLVHLLDISNPFNPRELADIDVFGWPLDLEPRGNKLYAATYFGQSLTLLERVENPANILPVTRYARAFLPVSVALGEDRAYIVTSRFGNAAGELHIMDISDPNGMTFVSETEISGFPRGIDVRGRYAYVATDQGIAVIDMTDERNPQPAGASAPVGLESIVIDESLVYAASTDGDLRIFDLTDPTRPAETARVELPGTANRIALEGNFAYVASIDAGVYVVRLREDETPPEEQRPGDDGTGDDTGAGDGAGGPNGIVGPIGLDPAAVADGGGCGCRVASGEAPASAPAGALFLIIILPAIFFITLREKRRKP